MAAAPLRRHALPRDQGFGGFDELVDPGGGVAVGHQSDLDSAGDGVGDEGAAEGFEGLDLGFELRSKESVIFLELIRSRDDGLLFLDRRNHNLEFFDILACERAFRASAFTNRTELKILRCKSKVNKLWQCSRCLNLYVCEMLIDCNWNC